MSRDRAQCGTLPRLPRSTSSRKLNRFLLNRAPLNLFIFRKPEPIGSPARLLGEWAARLKILIFSTRCFVSVGPMKQKPGPTKPHCADREDILKPGNSIQVALGSNKPNRAETAQMTGDRHDQGYFRHRRRSVCCRRVYHPAGLRPAGRSQRAGGTREV